MATAHYNRLRGLSNVKIQLWVSFQPRNGDISYDIDTVLEAIHEVNSIAPNTVSTIVINYGFLKLDQQTLTLVNHEIRKVNKRLKSLPGEVLKLGLQISDTNCRGKREYIKYLEMNLLDFFVLMPMPQTKQFHTNDSGKTFAYCVLTANLMNTAVPPLIHSYESVEIDFEDGVYNYNKKFTHKYSNLYMYAFSLIRAEDKKMMVDSEQVPKAQNLATWLYQSTDFSKSHFGAVISSKDIKLMGLENFTSTILKSFMHIIIDSRNHDEFETEDYLERTVEAIARYSLSIKKHGVSGNQILNENTQLHASILVTIESNDTEVRKRQADRAISAALKGNVIFLGTVQRIFFDILACSRSEICSGNKKDELDKVRVQTKRIGNLTDIAYYAVDALAVIKPWQHGQSVVVIARTEDKQFEELKLECAHKKCDEWNAFLRFGLFSNLLCKAVIRYDDIVNYGGLKASKTVIARLPLCGDTDRIRKSIFVFYYVNLVGCVRDHSNMTMLVEYTKLMENLNAWAVAENILLFINAGVEPAKCEEYAEGGTQQDGCKCGWWLKQESHHSYKDKKSVALQLYEIAEGIVRTNDIKAITVVPKQSLLLLWVLIAVINVGVIIIITAAFLVYHYHSKYILTKQEIAEFIKGRQTTRAEPLGEGDEAAQTQSYSCEKYELSPSTFTIDITSSCLGSGEYARVYRGSIRKDGAEIEAAVKMTNNRLIGKSHGYYVALKGLLSEIKILAYVGKHNHVVALLGAYTKNVRKGEIAIFLELCHLGSLDKYLRSMKPQFVDDNETSTYTGTSTSDASNITEEENDGRNIQVLNKESSDELYRLAGEIANGMEFLVLKKLVHGDLASRNILLTGDKIAKIADFGLSRRLYDYTEYVKRNQTALPWRWMPPESLCRSAFNEKSDVWAFGVTLWEMFTLGDQPYPGLSWTPNFPALLERGIRLPEPRFNLNEIYSVMLRCWDINPSMRPSFAQLKAELNPVQ